MTLPPTRTLHAAPARRPVVRAKAQSHCKKPLTKQQIIRALEKELDLTVGRLERLGRGTAKRQELERRCDSILAEIKALEVDRRTKAGRKARLGDRPRPTSGDAGSAQ
jgi:hypothetical protein